MERTNQRTSAIQNKDVQINLFPCSSSKAFYIESIEGDKLHNLAPQPAAEGTLYRFVSKCVKIRISVRFQKI